MTQMIESVSGDMIEKYNTYTYMMKRYNEAKKHEFYFEGMLIVYAMLEDRLRSFVYHAGFLDERDSRGLGNKKLKSFVRSLMADFVGINTETRIKFDNISCKIDVIKALLLWSQSDRKPVGKFQTELKKQLKKTEPDQFISIFSKLSDWLKYRNEVIHGLMNKKTGKLNNSLPEMVEKGFSYARFIDKQVGRINKNDSLRCLRTSRR